MAYKFADKFVHIKIVWNQGLTFANEIGITLASIILLFGVLKDENVKRKIFLFKNGAKSMWCVCIYINKCSTLQKVVENFWFNSVTLFGYQKYKIKMRKENQTKRNSKLIRKQLCAKNDKST